MTHDPTPKVTICDLEINELVFSGEVGGGEGDEVFCFYSGSTILGYVCWILDVWQIKGSQPRREPRFRYELNFNAFLNMVKSRYCVAAS